MSKINPQFNQSLHQKALPRRVAVKLVYRAQLARNIQRTIHKLQGMVEKLRQLDAEEELLPPTENRKYSILNWTHVEHGLRLAFVKVGFAWAAEWKWGEAFILSFHERIVDENKHVASGWWRYKEAMKEVRRKKKAEGAAAATIMAGEKSAATSASC